MIRSYRIFVTASILYHLAFLLALAIEPFNIPAGKPNSLHTPFTSLGALTLRSSKQKKH